MKILPAIDVRGGQVVRLRQGDYARETRYDEDPCALARKFRSAGAGTLHLVDLDAARSGGYTLHALLRRIVDETDLVVQTGGGLRTAGDVEDLFDAGAGRAVIGTLAVTRTREVTDWIGRFGPERLCVAVDVRRSSRGHWFAATHGWTGSDEQLDAFSLVEALVDGGLRHLLSTDIHRDGMLSGPAVEWYASLTQRFPDVRVQASGGVRDLADVRATRNAGCDSVVIGRALLEGRVDLAEALAC